MTRIGIVGFGEAGSAFAKGLLGEGVDVAAYDITFLEPAELRLRERAEALGVEVVEDIAGLVEGADAVLVLATASAAADIARSLAAHVRRGQLVADLNSKSPQLARELASIIEPTGAMLIDVAVMAAVPQHGHRVPMLASGVGAERLRDLGVGLDVLVLDGDVGTAAGIKMLRSVLIKGLEALLVEFSIAAHRAGVTAEVLRSVNEASLPMEDWEKLTDYLLARNAQHGERRARELDEAASLLRQLDVEPVVVTAAAKRLHWTARQGLAERFKDAPPNGHEEFVNCLRARERLDEASHTSGVNQETGSWG